MSSQPHFREKLIILPFPLNGDFCCLLSVILRDSDAEEDASSRLCES